MRNLVLLTVDALRKDVLGCYGNKSGLTPFIDSLQDKCIRFTKAQSIGPYTEASFPGILTSSYYLDYGREKKLSLERTLISEVLKEFKVMTAGFHSNPYLSDYFGWNRGWDVFYDSMDIEISPEVPYVRGNEINREVSEWLTFHAKKKENKPLFLWLHYMDVHEPYVPEKNYIDIIDPHINLSKSEMFSLFKDVLLKRDTSDEKKVEILKKLYEAKVRETDGYVEEFFGILNKLTFLEDSVIIITADHGEEFNEHGGLSHDGKMYSELIDVPLLIYDHEKSQNETCEAPVSNVDLPPTITYLFGLEKVKTFKGRSLLPIQSYCERGCFGEAIDKRGSREKDMDKPIYFYRERNLKVIYRESCDAWEMYDLEKDPGELENIVATSPMANYLMEKMWSKVMTRKNYKHKCFV